MRLYSFRSFATCVMGGSLSKRVTAATALLTGKRDIYDGITILSKDHRHVKRRIARQVLQHSLEQWAKNDIHGIWFEVDVKDVWWIPILLDQGFAFHHTASEYLMMTKWLLTTPNKLPKYPFTFIGAGGLVVNSRGEVLLMRERRGPFLGWKFPGGAADYGELVHDAAVREVREETGLNAEFVTILAFRQTIKFRGDICSNIYFICVLKPKDENDELKPCPWETAACRWMSRSEIDALPESDFRCHNREVLRKYDTWLASGRRGCYYVDETEVRLENGSVNEPAIQPSDTTAVLQNGKLESGKSLHEDGEKLQRNMEKEGNNANTVLNPATAVALDDAQKKSIKSKLVKGSYFFD